MNALLIAIMLGFTLSPAAHAAGAAANTGNTKTQAAPTSQQNKMKQCNAEAKGKHGAERKAFMSECLRKKPAS